MLPLICTVHKMALPSLWGFLLPETRAKVLRFHIRKEKVAQSHYWAVESRPGIYIRPYTPPVLSTRLYLDLSASEKKVSCSQTKFFLMLYVDRTEGQSHSSTSSTEKSLLLCNFISRSKDWTCTEICLVFMAKAYGKVPDGVQKSPNLDV